MTRWVESIPWVIATVGFGATHIFAEARERRKEVRNQLDGILSRISRLEDEARGFHTAVTYDEVKARAIDAEVERIERLISRLAQFEDDDLTRAIIDHRQALTLQNFDKSDFQTQTVTSDLVERISAASVVYEEALERVYRRRYPSKFPYFQLFPKSISSESFHLGAATFFGALIGGTLVYLLTEVAKASVKR